MQHRTNTSFAALSRMRFGFVALQIPSDVHPGVALDLENGTDFYIHWGFLHAHCLSFLHCLL